MMPVASNDCLLDNDGMTRVSRNLLKLMHRTDYRLIQVNGQRRYGGPPPDWIGPPPPKDSEIFVGKIPRNCYEDELVPVFETVGKIYELRLMMDFSGSNRGYAFVMYTNPETADKAVKVLNDFEIRKGRRLGVVKSVNNCRLFIGGLPGSTAEADIKTVIQRLTEGVVDIWVHPAFGGGPRWASKGRRGAQYAIVEYESHRAAAMARRRLIPERVELWGREIVVDWVAAGHVRSPSGFQPEEVKATEISQRSLPLHGNRSRGSVSQESPSPTISTCSSSLDSWSLERAMDEELYGTYITGVRSKDVKHNPSQTASNITCGTFCMPKSMLYAGEVSFSTNLTPVCGATKNGLIRELNSFGGLATQVFESELPPSLNITGTITGLHGYEKNQYCINFETPCSEIQFTENKAKRTSKEETYSSYVNEPAENSLPELFSGLTVNGACRQPLYNRGMLLSNNKRVMSEENPLKQGSQPNCLTSPNMLVSNINLPHEPSEVTIAYYNQNYTLWNNKASDFDRAPGAPLLPTKKSFTRLLKSL